MLVIVVIELLIIVIMWKIIKAYQMDCQNHMNTIEKLKCSYALCIEWIDLFQKKKSIESYLLERGYSSIIIYGLSDVGHRLFQELYQSKIQIVSIIDQTAFGKMKEIDIISPNDSIPEADMVIVASTYFLLEIEQALEGKVSCPIVALDDLIAEIDGRL